MVTVPQPLAALMAAQGPLLDAVDSLRPFGIESRMAIPQLIVVGHQNSGKSSVLESISGMPFAVDHNLCTRFPIELALRRSQNEQKSVTATISPGKYIKRTDKERSALEKFKRIGKSTHDIPHFIEEAKTALGIQTQVEVDNPEESTQNYARQFTDDVLKIEIQGPRQHPITLIDLPGCYFASTRNQGVEGIDFVDRMVHEYMNDKMSIVLVVLSASDEPTAQRFTRLADQERTLGIITRPDTRPPGIEQDKVIQLAMNEMIWLKRGWHTVKNMSADERQELLERQTRQDVDDDVMDKRDESEAEFFHTGDWASVPSSDKGIESLRLKLSNMLVEHIKSNLPELIYAVNNLKRNRSLDYDKLGVSRQSPQDHRKFMMPMAEEFSRICRAAVTGVYDDAFFGKPGDHSRSSQETRLRANITEMCLLFTNVMMVCGRKVYGSERDGMNSQDTGCLNMEKSDDSRDKDPHSSTTENSNDNMEDQDGASKGSGESNAGENCTRVMNDGMSVADIFALESSPESTVLVEDLFQGVGSPAVADEVVRAYYTHRKPILVPWTPLMKFISSEVVRWKGRDGPGDTNSSLTRALFKEQSKPWLWIVESHCRAVWGAIKTFVNLALRHSVHPSIRAGVRRNVVNSALGELRHEFEQKCREIVDGFTDVHPAQIVGHLWQPEGKKIARMVQVVDRIIELERGTKSGDIDSAQGANLSFRLRLLSAARSWELADICLEMCSKNVSAAVNVLAVESCLRKVPGVFSPVRLNNMGDETLNTAAEETEEQINLRQKAEKDLLVLSRVLKTLEQYRSLGSAMKETQGLSDELDSD